MLMKSRENAAPEVVEGRSCPQCESDLIIRSGRYGKFIGCSNYPNCKYIEPLEKPENTGVQCPECKKGNILKRKSRRGKIFFSCERYPDCKYAIWNQPLAQPCPQLPLADHLYQDHQAFRHPARLSAAGLQICQNPGMSPYPDGKAED